MKISAVILARNEEKNIRECLHSLSFCDEKIVIDDLSYDNTREIAKGMGAKVFERKLEGDFASQRNYGLKKAKHEWVLFVDADERISENLAYEILNFPITKDTNGFYIKRTDFLWKKELNHGEPGNVRLLRFARKNNGIWEGKVHETWKIKGEVLEFKNPLLHYPHQSVHDFLEAINLYTDLRAKELYETGQRAYPWSIMLYPKAKFILNYIILLGILDGIPGFLQAMMMSFHSFLVRGKLWLLWQTKSK